jgi:serine protease AprX
MIKKLFIVSTLSYSSLLFAVSSGLIDKNVYSNFTVPSEEQYVSVLVFFNSNKNIPKFIQDLKAPNIHVELLNFMPTVVVTCPRQLNILKSIASAPGVKSIALNEPAGEKIEINTHTKKIKNTFLFPGIDLWWSENFKGQSGIVGIIDSGIAIDHPALLNKKIIINKSPNSSFFKFPQGVRSPHGTGVACIYAGSPITTGRINRGLSYKVPIILSTLAGEGSTEKENYWITYSGLNWLFSQNPLKPSVINYSFGNGPVSCSNCPDWSGMSKVVDYIVNKHKILWVTSAGNNGYVKQKKTPPFTSTLTVPADSYNALTVANMDMYDNERILERNSHSIRYTSSRGPTLLGRKKPDITAPGNDTYTCAPDPNQYEFDYNKEANYKNGYRLMGGTSSAAPHVGAAILIIKEAGIDNPMAIKALLINSSDTWTDNNEPGPNDPAHPVHIKGHHPRLGSEWNPTYGWGYINMEHAYYQKDNILEDVLSSENPIVEYKMKISNKDKITVVHERRVGFNKNGKSWPLAHLKLEIYDFKNHKLLSEDSSGIDTVHQVSLCHLKKGNRCAMSLKDVIVRITLVSSIEGADYEPFALAFSSNYPAFKL